MRDQIKILLLTMSLLTPAALWSQEGKPPTQAQMEAMMKAMTPGKEHKMLTEGAGKWQVVTTMWMYPGADPVTSEGMADSKAILGGRYLLSEQSGTAMGMPYQGMAITGYDNVKKQYTLAWRSTMDTSVTQGQGNYEEATKTIHYKGTMADPTSGGDIPYRYSVKFVDHNTMVHEMYMATGDQETKMFVAEYKRKAE